MKKIITVIALCLATLSYAQDTKADQLLKEVANKVKSYDNLVFNYKGKITNTKAKQNIDVKGDATLSGDNYNVNFMGNTYIYDGNKLYMINREDEQVSISTPDTDSTDQITPSNIMTFYEKGYRAQWDIEQNVRGRKIQYVKLIPIKSDSDYATILLGIDINTKHIYNAIVNEKVGNKATFTLLSLKTNQPLSEKSFQFDANDYDGWDIEDLD